MGNESSKPLAKVSRKYSDVRLSSETVSASEKSPFDISLFLTNLEDRVIAIDIDNTPLHFPQASRHRSMKNYFIDVESRECVIPYDGSRSLTCYMASALDYNFQSDHYVTLLFRHERRIKYVLNSRYRFSDHQYSSNTAKKLLDLSNQERDKWYRIDWDKIEVQWWCDEDMDFMAKHGPTKLPYHTHEDVGKAPSRTDLIPFSSILITVQLEAIEFIQRQHVFLLQR